jgi:methylamine dehydrogenase heavy chain
MPIDLRSLAASIGVGLFLHVGCSLASQFQPQHLTEKTAIDPGGNVFVLDQEWGGSSMVNVFSAEDLTYKGNLSTGTMAQMMLSPDGKIAYTASVYLKRITYGAAEMVLQSFDVRTLSPKDEIALPAKFAMLFSYPHMVAGSADGKYLFVQNATPATSVTVVDLMAGKVAGEIPTPGCFGIYPSLQANKFSVVCGDGTFASYVLSPDGSTAERTASEKIFDVDKDPIFIPAQRSGSDWIFVSFHGNVYQVSDRDNAVRLLSTYSITAGTTGRWAPGGFELIALNQQNHVLFVGMHPDAKDGSHKRGAREIWAYNLADRRLLHRSPVDDVLSLTVSDDAKPVLFAIKRNGILRYEVDAKANFALRKTHEKRNFGQYTFEVVYRP